MQITAMLAAGELTVQANPLSSNLAWFTNSLLVTIIVTALVVIWAQPKSRREQ